jgi:hypothetical protein
VGERRFAMKRLGAATKLAVLTAPLLSGFLVIGLTPALAKGPPDQVIIEGPGMTRSLEVRDPRLTEALGLLQDYEREAFAPLWFEDAYLITRGSRDGEEYWPFDQVLYVPNNSGGPGWVYYIGIFNGWGPYDGKWYQAVPENEAILQVLLAAQAEATLTFVPPPAAEPTLAPFLPAGAVGALAGAGGMAGVFAVRSTRPRGANHDEQT